MTINRRTLITATGLVASLPLSAIGAMPPAGPWTGQGDVRRGGGQIHYATLGADDGRPPLVLLPKLGGWIADWRHAAPYLAAGRRVIAIDLPGHGESHMLGQAPYVQTLPESAAMVLAALDEIGVDRFALVGNSLGGCIGIVMAALQPKRIDKLALVSVSLAKNMSRSALAEQEAAAPPGLWTVDGRALPRGGKPNVKFGTLDPRVDLEQDESRAAAGYWLRPSERGVALTDITAYLPRIEVPTLLIYADRGFYLQYEAVGRDLIHTAKVVHIGPAGSFVHQEKPAETAAAINAFLAA